MCWEKESFLFLSTTHLKLIFHWGICGFKNKPKFQPKGLISPWRHRAVLISQSDSHQITETPADYANHRGASTESPLPELRGYQVPPPSQVLRLEHTPQRYGNSLSHWIAGDLSPQSRQRTLSLLCENLYWSHLFSLYVILHQTGRIVLQHYGNLCLNRIFLDTETIPPGSRGAVFTCSVALPCPQTFYSLGRQAVHPFVHWIIVFPLLRNPQETLEQELNHLTKFYMLALFSDCMKKISMDD